MCCRSSFSAAPSGNRAWRQLASTRPSPAWWLLRSDKTRSHPELGRQTLLHRWYCVLRPGRVGRCQACEGRNFLFSMTFFNGGLRLRNPPFASVSALAAGWSSPVARQAHNLKVAGSNPAPATKLHGVRSMTWRRFSVRGACFGSYDRILVTSEVRRQFEFVLLQPRFRR
jgi:hypothetical protein